MKSEKRRNSALKHTAIKNRVEKSQCNHVECAPLNIRVLISILICSIICFVSEKSHCLLRTARERGLDASRHTAHGSLAGHLTLSNFKLLINKNGFVQFNDVTRSPGWDMCVSLHRCQSGRSDLRAVNVCTAYSYVVPLRLCLMAASSFHAFDPFTRLSFFNSHMPSPIVEYQGVFVWRFDTVWKSKRFVLPIMITNIIERPKRDETNRSGNW